MTHKRPESPPTQKEKDRPLAGRQADFVRTYLADPELNATRAYIAAGYSPVNARSGAWCLMQRPNVAAAIKREIDARAKRSSITADRILEEIDKIALLDPRKFFNQDGELIAIHELDDDTARALASFEVATVERKGGAVEYIAKIRPADKLRALELAGKHRGMFIDKKEISGPDGGPVMVESFPADPIEAAKAYQRMIQADD